MKQLTVSEFVLKMFEHKKATAPTEGKVAFLVTNNQGKPSVIKRYLLYNYITSVYTLYQDRIYPQKNQ